MRTCQNGAQIVQRARPDRADFIVRSLERSGQFIGIDGDAFHRAAQRLAANDSTLELIDNPQPFRQGGKPTTLAGWLLRRRATGEPT